MADIQEYSVSIKFKTEGSEKAANDTKKINDSLGKLKGAASAFDGLKTGLGKFTKFSGTVAKGVIVATAAAGTSLVKAGKSASKYSKEMMDYIETVNLFSASMGNLADEAMKLVNRGEFELGLNPQEMMNAISSFQNLAEGFGIVSDRAYIMSSNLAQLSGDLSSFANISYEAAQKKLMSGFAGQVLPLRQYGIALDQASLQELAYSLGLEQKVKTMTRAQKTELIYYQIMKSTQKMQGDLGRTLMSPANALRVMQNEFKALARAVGSIFIPIMQKIIPIMRMVTKALTQAAQAIASFFGFDISNYTADLSGVGSGLEGIADDIEDVGGAADGTAKKLNKMLMPFDELNNINSNEGSGSSGAGGGGIGGGSLGIDLPQYDMFAFIDDRVDKFEDILGKVEKFAHKINELLEGIDWGKIKTQAGNVGKFLGDFLNVGIREIDWNLVGKTFAEGINTIIEFGYNFVTTFDWKEFGFSIADTINGFFRNIDWAKLGETVGEGIKGLLDTAIEFISNLDIDAVQKAVTDFLFNIDWAGIFQKLALLLTKLTIIAFEMPINAMIKASKALIERYPVLEYAGGVVGALASLEEIHLENSIEGIAAFGGAMQLAQKEAIESSGGIQKSVEELNTVTVQTFDELENKSFQWGKNTGANYNKGLESEQPNTNDIFQRVISKAMELDQSNNTREYGSKTIQAYSEGVDNQSGTVQRSFDWIKVLTQGALGQTGTARALGSSVITEYGRGAESNSGFLSGVFNSLSRTTETLKKSNSYSWGQDMVQGFIWGIQSKQNTLTNVVSSLAGGISKFLHFSKPDAGPLREYETWMPDMVEGLSNSLLKAMPELNNTVLKMAEIISQSISQISMPEITNSIFANDSNAKIIGQIANKTTVANKNAGAESMLKGTYDAMAKALSDNNANNKPQMIQVNVGNKELYRGYGQYRDEESNMLGITT